MGCQVSDHIPGTSVGQVGINDLAKLLFADTTHIEQLFWFLIQNLQGLFAVGIVDPLSGLLADTFDLSGGKVCDDTFFSRRYHLFIPFDFELDSVLLILAPPSFHPVFDLFGCRKAVPNCFKPV